MKANYFQDHPIQILWLIYFS